MRRVAITGIGTVTPLGNDLPSTWDSIIRKQSGIGAVTRCDTSRLACQIGGEVKGFAPESFVSRKDVNRFDPFVIFAAAAATMAIRDARLTQEEIRASRGAVIIGSSRGGISTMERALERHFSQARSFSAFLMSSSTVGMASSYVSMLFGIQGPAIGVSTACASGAHALGEAYQRIRSGEIDMACAGGAEAPLCRLAIGGYSAARALSTRNHEPERASRPFDAARDGFVLSEGAAIMILEDLQHAMQRGAPVYAELAGYGASSDAFHETRPHSQGEALAMTRALENARLSTDQVDYINAHATSTLLGDRAEADAIRAVFGDRSSTIPVSSCKSMLGHMLGAAGAVEAAVTALSIKKGIIIPARNIENPDPACNLNYATEPRQHEIAIALSNSFGFGGSNAVLLLQQLARD